jgi:hypothetical protein
MYTVRQVLSPGFPRTWQEAVAIVQEAASLLQPGLALPDPEDLILSDGGALSFGFGSETSQHPVSGLATLLKQLLDGVDAPESLLVLAASNTQEKPEHSTIEGFSRALSFFERPNRANDLQSVTARLRGAPEEKSALDFEFQKLRQKVSGTPAEKKTDAAQQVTSKPVAEATEEREQDEQDEEDEPGQQKRRAKRRVAGRQQYVVAAGIFVGVFLGLLAVKNPLPSVRRAIADTKFGSSVSAGLDRVGLSQSAAAAPAGSETASTSGTTTSTLGTSAASGKSAAEPLERGRTSNRVAARAPSAAPVHHSKPGHPAAKADDRTDVTSAGENAADPRTPGLQSRSLSPPTVRTEPAELAPVVAPVASPVPALPNVTPRSAVPPANGVYSPDTPGVNPPVLVRPQMPREPAPGDDTGYFDMIVDEKGLVEQVKLISPRRRYHDRMLVAAAKAWQFRPATLEGQPVKYRILVPIILSGLPY